MAALAVLLGAEGLATAMRALRCTGSPPSILVPDARFGWTHPASSDVDAWSCDGSAYEWSTTVSFNDGGLHDSPVSLERSPGRPRILVLGDSATEAVQVPTDRNFSERLEAALGPRPGAWEVVNAGHAGFGPAEHLLFFEAEGRLYRPDVVVVAFHARDDLDDVLDSAAGEGPGPDLPRARVVVAADGTISVDPSACERAEAAWRRSEGRNPAAAWFCAHSALARLLACGGPRDAEGLATPARRDDVAVRAASSEPGRRREALRAAEALLLRLRERVERDGAKLLVLLVPSRGDLEGTPPAGEEPAVREWLAGFAARQGVEFVDPTDHWRRRRSETGRPGFFAVDPHPDADGHRWIAEAAFPSVVSLVAASR